MSIDSNQQQTPDELIESILPQLQAYGQAHGLRGLEGRITRGLDPAGMLAVEETRLKLEQVAKKLDANMEEVIALTNRLHVGAIWEDAGKLSEAKEPAVIVWMIAAEACEKRKGKEGDMSPDEFFSDTERVNVLLDEAVSDTAGFADSAKRNLVENAEKKFTVTDGVAFSESDDGFLSAAMKGHKAAIVKDKDGLLFVGAQKLDYDILEQNGLQKIQKQDRGREATFYAKDGADVVKVLYPGFCIILNGDEEAARLLAKTAV